MENRQDVSLTTSALNCGMKQRPSSIKQALSDRLLLSEAIEAVARMIRGYANSGSAGKSYIGAMAEILAYYPRSVALRCADPIHGVARETKFLPTPADVIGWCEKAVGPMHEASAREDRVAEQLRERGEWEGAGVSPRLKEMGKAWLDRSDPVARDLVAENLAAEALRKDTGLARIAAANREVFERECRAAGVDSGGMASPGLCKLIAQQGGRAFDVDP